MLPFVEHLSRADMQDLAAYYAAQSPTAPTGTADPENARLAQQLMQKHHCNSCHTPTLEGQKHIPRLAGQHYQYLVTQLQAFKAQARTDMDGSMTIAAQPLSEIDIEALADYMAHWQPTP